MSGVNVGYRWGMLLTTVWLCCPVLSTRYPPLVDLPNHLARAEILHTYDSVPAVRLAYLRSTEPMPNLASDIVVTFFRSFFDLMTASKLFLLLSIVLFAFGGHLLGRAIHARDSWLAVPCSFFVYNSMLLYGFVNYVFALGLFSLSLALWLNWRKKWTALRLVTITALALAAYLAHLSAYSFLGVTFVVFAAWSYFVERVALRSVVLSLLPLIPPAIVFWAFMSGSGRAGRFEWNTVVGKLVGLLSLFLSYNRIFDAFFLAGLLLIVVAVLRRWRDLRVQWPALIAGLLLFVCYLISPLELFTASGVDARFFPPAVLLIVLSLQLDLPRALGARLLFACLLLASIRVGTIWNTWRVLDTRIGAEVSRLDVVREDASIYPVFVLPLSPGAEKTDRAFRHVVHYAGIGKRALIPTLFAYPSQQPVSFRIALQFREPASNHADDWIRSSDEWLPHVNEYDYVWSYGADRALKELLRSKCDVVYDDDGFMLCRVTMRERA